MAKTLRILTVLGALSFVAPLASQAEAGWGRYRVSTYYGTPSVPVVRETMVVRSFHRPVVVASAPAVVSSVPVTAYYGTPVTSYYGAPVTAYYSAPVTTYYGAPAVYIPAPRRAVRATYYAPAPGAYFYAPAPAAYYYYHGYSPGTVILP